MAAMRDDISSGSDDLSLSTSDEESVGGEGKADDGDGHVAEALTRWMLHVK